MKQKFIFCFLIILIGFLPGLSSGQNSQSEKDNVRLGVSQINITPGVPVLMSGYDARKTPFTGVHDSLYASALYFTRQNIKALIITSDLIGFSFKFVDDVKQRISAKAGIPVDNIMITAVHNHGGPAVSTYEDSLSSANEKYIGILKEKLTALAIKASENPVPFRLGIGKGLCNMNINRRAEFADGGIWLGRNPDGPCDHELDIIKFEDMTNKTMAVLINWPCHGTASGQENYQITGDWPGAAARYIRKLEG
jgi:neutral ceramidase